MKTMTKKDKDLLLKDLCARLPYGFTIYRPSDNANLKISDIDDFAYVLEYSDGEEFKPYLRSLSSMMQGEWEEMTALIYPYGRVNRNPDNKNELLLWLSAEGNEMPIMLINNVFSWLNEHHFDYHGLIEKGLSLEAPEGMYKTNE